MPTGRKWFASPRDLTSTRQEAQHIAPLLELLIVVGMFVAPIPVVSLFSGMLAVVLAIGSVPLGQVTTVSAVFVIVPIVVVAVIPIVDSDLDAGVLRFRLG